MRNEAVSVKPWIIVGAGVAPAITPLVFLISLILSAVAPRAHCKGEARGGGGAINFTT